MKTLIGTKLGMIQITSDEGVVFPVTLIKAGPCVVTQVKTTENDGYESVQLGYDNDDKLPKSIAGHVKKSKATPKVLKEFRITSDEDVKVGDTINVDAFKVGDKVKVTGTGKGKGFAGTVKRHNFNTGPKSHGSKNVRRPGSIGSMYPQKVFKGKKMAGQLGSKQVSTKNLEVALVIDEDSIVGLRGAVPGPRKSLVTIEGVK